jgi:hypothetical protein
LVEIVILSQFLYFFYDVGNCIKKLSPLNVFQKYKISVLIFTFFKKRRP